MGKLGNERRCCVLMSRRGSGKRGRKEKEVESPPKPQKSTKTTGKSAAFRKNVPKICRGILKELISHKHGSKFLNRSDDLEDEEKPRDFATIRKKLSDASYAGVTFGEDMQYLLETLAKKRGSEGAAAKELLGIFEREWKDQFQSQIVISSSIVGRAANASRKQARKREYTDKEKKLMVEKFALLPAKGLVEAIHLLKIAQPELDVRMDPAQITIEFDELSHDALAALDGFLRKINV